MQNDQTNQSTNIVMDRKKVWQSPELVKLAVNRTKGGEHDWFDEDSFLGRFFGGRS